MAFEAIDQLPRLLQNFQQENGHLYNLLSDKSKNSTDYDLNTLQIAFEMNAITLTLLTIIIIDYTTIL